MLQITPNFWVALEDDRVMFWHPQSKSEYTVREALMIANVLKGFVEQEAGVLKVTPEGLRRVLPPEAS